MADFFTTTLNLIGQFTGGRGGPEQNIVQFVLAGVAWAALLTLALQQKKRHNRRYDRLLAWGFGFGLSRELFMLSVICLSSYGAVAADTLHVIFPPVEHALHDLAMIIIAAAYIGHLLKNDLLSRRYLQTGVATVTLLYLATFWWWGRFSMANPGAKFGQTWGDLAFRSNASLLMAVACLLLLWQAKGWRKNAACTAFFFFFLFHFLKIVDMSLAESYEHVFAPIRHALYIAAIPIFGYISVREFLESERQAREDLAASESLYRTLVENIDLGITLIDRNYRIIMANATQGKLAKKHCLNLIGGYCYREFSKKDGICPQCPGGRAMESGKPQEVVKEGIRGDGSPITVRIRAFPVLEADGQAQSFIEVVEDITQRVKTEQELQRARHLESIGVLAGGIAHDFNNILAAIFGFTDLARMKAGEDSPVADELRQIRRASERARDLVQQILTLSRRQEHKPLPYRFSSLVKEALKLLRSTIPANIAIKEEIETEAMILVDPSQAHQLVMNLCTNAYHAMQDSGGTLTVALHVTCLEESALTGAGGKPLPAGKYAQLVVSDTGSGIAEEALPKIFEPYFTTKEVGRGTGLGLAVVHGIVKGANGAVTVASKAQEGTTFTVYLPVVEESAAAEEEKREEETPAGGHERIMIVDDEENICLLSFTFLSQAGYQVDTFLDGIDAWEAFSGTPDRWDLVITDQAMPEMTGAQLTSKIREIRPDLPVILCTGHSDIVSRDTAQAFGCRAFLQKPVTRIDLLRTVHQVLHPAEQPVQQAPPAPDAHLRA